MSTFLEDLERMRILQKSARKSRSATKKPGIAEILSRNRLARQLEKTSRALLRQVRSRTDLLAAKKVIVRTPKTIFTMKFKESRFGL